jgi:hypothetical protein
VKRTGVTLQNGFKSALTDIGDAAGFSAKLYDPVPRSRWGGPPRARRGILFNADGAQVAVTELCAPKSLCAKHRDWARFVFQINSFSPISKRLLPD